MVVRRELTLDEFAALPASGVQHELDRGALIEMPPPKFPHSAIVRRLDRSLTRYLEDHSSLGEVYVEAGFLLSESPATVRQPDLAYLRAERIPADEPDAYLAGAPDLAVEVVSPSDSAGELRWKVTQYLQTGAAAVWVVYPQSRTVDVYRPGQPVVVLSAADELTAEELLPGWRLPIAQLFV